jgi:hypothetical protein
MKSAYRLRSDRCSEATNSHRRVHNIEVEDFHTYYVGEAGLWVHNTECLRV